jgi:hypothetical protein
LTVGAAVTFLVNHSLPATLPTLFIAYVPVAAAIAAAHLNFGVAAALTTVQLPITAVAAGHFSGITVTAIILGSDLPLAIAMGALHQGLINGLAVYYAIHHYQRHQDRNYYFELFHVFCLQILSKRYQL